MGGPDADLEHSTQRYTGGWLCRASCRWAATSPRALTGLLEHSRSFTFALKCSLSARCPSNHCRPLRPYAGYEPTSMRAIRARYSPYVQARGRVDQLRRLGHSVDKVRRRMGVWLGGQWVWAGMR